MEFNALHPLSRLFVVQDVLIAVGAGVALVASLVFINLKVLLPDLLTSLGGPQSDQRGAYLEFGPAGSPIISEPAPPRAAPPETDVKPRPVARPHLWGLSLGVRPRI